MSKIRNSHVIPTGALAANAPVIAVNVQEAVVVENGIAENELNFQFQHEIAGDEVWAFADQATRDAEYVLLVMSSADIVAGTQKPFVESSLATVADKFGVQLDKIASISIDSVKELDESEVFRIVFNYKSVSYAPKSLFWTYADEADRDTVFGEVTGVIGGATIL